MAVKTKFILSAVQAAKDCKTELPWSRGARRMTQIVERTSKAPSLKRA